MQAFDEACRRCAQEIAAGQFDLLFANSSVGYNVPFILRHLRMRKVLYLQEPCRYLYEARPVLPWVSNAPEELDQADLFSLRPSSRITTLCRPSGLKAKQEWLNVEFLRSGSRPIHISAVKVFYVSYGVDAKVCYLGVDTALFRESRIAARALHSRSRLVRFNQGSRFGCEGRGLVA